MARWIPRIAAVVGIALVAATVYTIVEPVQLFGFDGKAPKRSLQDEAPTEYGAAKCTQEGGGWRCLIATGASSGYGAAYELDVDDDGCWTAEPVRYGNSPLDSSQPALAACVDLTDIIL